MPKRQSSRNGGLMPRNKYSAADGQNDVRGQWADVAGPPRKPSRPPAAGRKPGLLDPHPSSAFKYGAPSKPHKRVSVPQRVRDQKKDVKTEPPRSKAAKKRPG